MHFDGYQVQDDDRAYLGREVIQKFLINLAQIRQVAKEATGGIQTPQTFPPPDLAIVSINKPQPTTQHTSTE